MAEETKTEDVSLIDGMDGRKKRLLGELSKTHGLVTLACQQANIARASYYNWYNNDPIFAEACQEILERTYDHVENRLLQNIKQGDTTAIIFYCKTKMKHRGYSERLEIAGANGGAIQTQHSIEFKVNEADLDAIERLKLKLLNPVEV